MASEKCSKEFIGFTREQIHDPISSRPLEAFTWGSLAKVILCGGPKGRGLCGCVRSYMFVPTYCIHTYICTYVCTHIRTCIHTHMYICAIVHNLCTHVHTYVRMYITCTLEPFTAVYVYVCTYCVYHTYVRTLCQHSDWFYIRII